MDGDIVRKELNTFITKRDINNIYGIKNILIIQGC